MLHVLGSKAAWTNCIKMLLTVLPTMKGNAAIFLIVEAYIYFLELGDVQCVYKTNFSKKNSSIINI